MIGPKAKPPNEKQTGLGFRWPLLGALAIEAVPGLAVFPAWTLVVVTLAGTETQRLPDDPGTVGHGAGPIQKP